MTPTPVTLEVSSAEQEAVLRQFHGLLLEMEQLALSAPPGQVIDRCEALVLQRGQDVNRQLLQQAVQQRIEALEKKGRRCEPVTAVGRVKIAAPARSRS
jgi:hypothetical protein